MDEWPKEFAFQPEGCGFKSYSYLMVYVQLFKKELTTEIVKSISRLKSYFHLITPC